MTLLIINGLAGLFSLNCHMPAKSAGILLYRITDNQLQVLLVHPGGPFWKNKDLGAWSIPKGEFDDNEEPLKAALREFEEETGAKAEGEVMELPSVKMKSGKIVYCFAIKGDFNPAQLNSNLFELEWPPKSGKFQSFPEVDKCAWFGMDEARKKINQSQARFIDELAEKLK